MGQNRSLVCKSIGQKAEHAQNQVDAYLEALNVVFFQHVVCFMSLRSDTIIFLTDGV